MRYSLIAFILNYVSGHTITSDGTREKPYCSWMMNCEWSDEVKDDCSHQLCISSGYDYGTFISGVDMCSSSSNIISEEIWYWIADLQEYDFGQKSHLYISFSFWECLF